MLSFTLWIWMLALQAIQTPTAAPPAAGPTTRPPLAREAFAGVDACRPCHAGHLRTFDATAHARTSQPATRASIVAPFAPEASHVPTSSPDLWYRLEATDEGFFETAVIGPGPNPRLRKQHIDLVIGSGKKGQTYLWWRGDELFQLPLSYWTDFQAWSSNPGFTDRSANFTQPVIPRCLDCHATLVEPLTPTGNRYKRDTAILGVTCEKCHGPAAAHVAARRANAKRALTDGTDVVNPARLTRDQKVDLCASCHGSQKLGTPFSFRPGDAVKRPILAAEPSASSSGPGAANLGIDSHGQQATALMNSRCFRASSMTCETCHDPHITQRDPAVFSAKCTTCHTLEACGRFARDGRAIVGKCVDCHMPQQPSGLIISTSARGTTQARLRTHFIAVHPTEPR